MAGAEWWRFWSGASWREWWGRRPAWTEYRSQARRLDLAISQNESRLTATNSQLTQVNQQIAWAGEVRPQEVPIKIGRAETGLASIGGVALLETRKREGRETWVPVDYGDLYVTDRQAIFAGSKIVKFRFDKLTTQTLTSNGLHLATSTRKRSHILSGPAQKIAAVITASAAVGRGLPATSPFVAERDGLTATVAGTESQLDKDRTERSGLVVPPRPISPMWVPAVGLVLVVFIGSALAGPAALEPVALGGTTTTVSNQPATSTTDTTSPSTTTTSLVTTTTATTLPPVPSAKVIFAPPAPGDSGDPTDPLAPDVEAVTVASLTDGDTLRVTLDDGSTEPVRLIGINTPESGECWADEATLALATLTPVGSRIGVSTDISDRDQFDRLLRYLWVGSMSVNEELIRRGAAISRRYPPDTAMSLRLEAAQADAQQDQLGLWAPDACGPRADANLRIVDLLYDPEGNDNDNLNEELIQVQNNGDNLVDLTGWGIKDESASNRYSFPSGFSLAAGEVVTVYSGCGDDFGTDLYWCSVGSAIWNNDGDTAFLTDPNGNTHANRTYTAPTTTTQAPATTSSTSGGGGGDQCHPSYEGECVPEGVSDVDCLGGSGDGPYYVGRVTVVGPDVYRLDNDNDGVGCESS